MPLVDMQEAEEKGRLIWITGLAGSGKTTLAVELVAAMKKTGGCPVLIDGDHVRELFGNDLRYTPEDRLKNAYRIAKLCHWLTDQGIDVVCATVSLFHEIHDYNRDMNANYTEIVLDVDYEILKRRNKKNLYDEAAAEVVGRDQYAQFPRNPSYVIKNNDEVDLEENIKNIINIILK